MQRMCIRIQWRAVGLTPFRIHFISSRWATAGNTADAWGYQRDGVRLVACTLRISENQGIWGWFFILQWSIQVFRTRPSERRTDMAWRDGHSVVPQGCLDVVDHWRGDSDRLRELARHTIPSSINIIHYVKPSWTLDDDCDRSWIQYLKRIWNANFMHLFFEMVPKVIDHQCSKTPTRCQVFSFSDVATNIASRISMLITRDWYLAGWSVLMRWFGWVSCYGGP